MSQIIQLLLQNLFGIGLALVGLIAAYVFYRRSLVKAKIGFVSAAFRVTGRDSSFTPDLKIFFKNKEVERVTKSSLVVWNFGNATIHGDDIVASDPLRVQFAEDAEVLDAAITKSSRQVIGFLVRVREGTSHELECLFDYLDPNDGARIEILHTGDSTIRLEGSIRGIPSGVMDLGLIPASRARSIVARNSVFVLLSLTLLGISVFFLSRGYQNSFVGFILVASFFLSLFGIPTLATNAVVWAMGKPEPPSSLLPQEGVVSIYRRKLKRLFYTSGEGK